MECERCRGKKESAADAVQAHAAAWAAANNSDTSSSGNHFHELSYGGTASQPGVLSSLSKNAFGYAKATPSEQATTCPTAGGYEGSQSSMPERQLYHIDLYTLTRSSVLPPEGAQGIRSHLLFLTRRPVGCTCSRQPLGCLWLRRHLNHGSAR